MKKHFQTRRVFLKSIGVTTTVAFVPQCFVQESAAASSKKPNILMVLTDDQGFGDIGSHGNDLIDTPTMDSFADSNARFDRFFVSPMCAPTRASLLTGRYHLRTGCNGVTRGNENMRSEEVTIAEVLKENGYATGCFGKWHNGSNWPFHPNAQGFDQFKGFCSGHWNNYFDTMLEHNGDLFKSKGYINDVLTDYAIDFMQANNNKPFFCYVPYNTPHGPYQVPDKYFDKYKAKGLKDDLAAVYGMCESLDDNLKRLLKKLDTLGIADNTIVMFMTDNGPQFDRYNDNMKGRKGSVNEGGVRVPLFMRWPSRTKPKQVIKEITSHIDILPTVAAMCGIEKYKTKLLDGKNLVPLIDGDTDKWPDRMIFTFKFAQHGERVVWGSVRTQQYRAVRAGKKGDKWELYDMVADPSQKTNIAAKHPSRVKKFRAAYEKASIDATKDGFGLPIHIGHKEWPLVRLPGHEAFFEKHDKKDGISYKDKHGWSNDWITNWTNTSDYPWWPVKVVSGGAYEVSLMYICDIKNVGALIQIEVGDARVAGKIRMPHNPQPLPTPDRVKRGEVLEKVWAELKLGKINLTPGEFKLKVRALSRHGVEVMDLKAVHIKKMQG